MGKLNLAVSGGGGASTEIQVNGTDTTLQTPINFEGDGTYIGATNPSAGNVKFALNESATAAAVLASAALTGIPTCPTAAPLTDDSQVASTAYCDAAVATVVLTGALPPVATVTTASSSYTAGQTQNFSLTAAKTIAILRVTEATNQAFRLRLYSTSAARSADASRPNTIPLALGTQHMCILDLYVDQVNASTPWQMTPTVFGSNGDGPPATTTLYASVTNIANSTVTLAVSINYVPMES